MSPRSPIQSRRRAASMPSGLLEGRVTNPLVSRPGALTAVLLMLAVGMACATAPVDRSTNQTRDGARAADNGYWEEAEFRWLKALAIAANNARAHNNLAVRFERLAEFEEAKEHYDEALRLAQGAERQYVERNYAQFEPIWDRIQSGDVNGTADGPSSDDQEELPPLPRGEAAGIGVIEVEISVPSEGPNLAGFDRILIGNFLPREGTEANINGVAVPFLRRRITQRTFFQTQDQLDQAVEMNNPGLIDDTDYWMERAAAAEADLVLTGFIGVNTETASEMVRERIRTPSGEIQEVARFQDSVRYRVDFDYVLLRGSDGVRLLDGSLEAEQSFPADEGIADTEATMDTLEQMLPQILEAITPRRSEQSRYLIY